MRLRWPEAAVLVCGLAVLAACGGGSGDECDPSEFVFGSITASCPSEVVACQSWETFVAPGAGSLFPDWSTSPPHADVATGSRFRVGRHDRYKSPAGCNAGIVNYRELWRTTNPSILRIEDDSWMGANLVAVGPGAARVIAENLTLPGGRVGQVELTVCSEPGANDFTCRRVPLDIRVIP